MHTQKLIYQADGLSMDGQLFYERHGGRMPGVLVFPEAFGLGDHALSRARRLAELGYVALACDLHGGRQMILDIERIRAVMGPLFADVSRIRARAHGGLSALSACSVVDPGRIAAIGYCFGGTMALELARSGAPIACVVGFHSGLATAAPRDASRITGKVLVCLGADDPIVPPEQRRAFEEEMSLAGVDWQMSVYGGVAHSFTNPEAARLGPADRMRYDARADARSWRQMCGLLEEVLGSPPGHAPSVRRD